MRPRQVKPPDGMGLPPVGISINDTDHSFLSSHTSDYIVTTGLILLGFCCIFFNIFIFLFYKKERKHIVPLLYTIMSANDIVTGL